MSTLNNFEQGKEKEEEEIRQRMPSATLHYGSPPMHDPFMYRPFLPQPPPISHMSQPDQKLDQNGSRPLTTATATATAAVAATAGLRMSIYTCERCMHGFTHASDFLHHKAICMGTICSPEAEAKLRETVQAKMEKIMDNEKTEETARQESINFQHLAKSISANKMNLGGPRPPLSPGAAKSPRSGGGQRFNCRYCDKQFDAMYIQNHELTHLIDSPDKPYSCEFCGRQFANLPACQNHERIHLEPRPYICELCNKGFMTAGILKTHMLTHSGLKRYICPICDKAFSTAGNLKTHENIHRGEKPYACGQCGKCFTTAGNLKTHEKIHIGLKPFTCDFCGKNFTTAGNLRTHENIHTGNKPFECDQCHKSFTTAGNLKTHYRLHTGERPYVCHICSQAYHSSANLRSHQKGVHGIDVEPRSPRIFSPPLSPRINKSPGANISPGASGSFSFPRTPPAQVVQLPNASFNKPAFPDQMSPTPGGSGTFPSVKTTEESGNPHLGLSSPNPVFSHTKISNPSSLASPSFAYSSPTSLATSSNPFSNNPYSLNRQPSTNQKLPSSNESNSTATNSSQNTSQNPNSTVQVLPTNPFPNYFPTPKQSPKTSSSSPSKTEQTPPNENLKQQSPQNPTFPGQSPPVPSTETPRNDTAEKTANDVTNSAPPPLPQYPIPYNQLAPASYGQGNQQFFSL